MRAVCSSWRLHAAKSAAASQHWRPSTATSFWSATTSSLLSGTAAQPFVVQNGPSETRSSMASCPRSKSLGGTSPPLAKTSSPRLRTWRLSLVASSRASEASRRISGKSTKRSSINSKCEPNTWTPLKRLFVPAASASCATKASTKNSRVSNPRTRCCALSCKAVALSIVTRRAIRWTRLRSWPRHNAMPRVHLTQTVIPSPRPFCATTRPRQIATATARLCPRLRNHHPSSPPSSAGSIVSRSSNAASRRSAKRACSTVAARASASRKAATKTKSSATCWSASGSGTAVARAGGAAPATPSTRRLGRGDSSSGRGLGHLRSRSATSSDKATRAGAPMAVGVEVVARLGGGRRGLARRGRR
ncbi:hypothetical protein HDK90DRAFT_128605 [Phyllosticta capitalensis]|uniref:Uncharacterized protein n=1 Tax=Phyllosticta capitalensis TaxID=121624 RepID=A0ABR1YY60_9PEZI